MITQRFYGRDRNFQLLLFIYTYVCYFDEVVFPMQGHYIQFTLGIHFQVLILFNFIPLLN